MITYLAVRNESLLVTPVLFAGNKISYPDCSIYHYLHESLAAISITLVVEHSVPHVHTAKRGRRDVIYLMH